MSERLRDEGVAAFCRCLKPGLTLVDSNKNDMPKLEFAFEIAARMVTRGSPDRVSVLSWRSFLRLCGVWMIGDSLDTAYCWIFSRDALETINASGNQQVHYDGVGCNCTCLFLSAQDAHGFFDVCHSFNAAEERFIFESEKRRIS